MKKKSFIVSLEGLPGSGKTTVLNKLSEEYITVKEVVINENNFANLKREKYMYILNDVHKIIMAAEKIFKKSESRLAEENFEGVAFMDRYFPSTIGYEYVKLKNNQKNDYYFTLERIAPYIENGIIPDLYILIETDIEKSLKRKGDVNRNDVWGNENDLILMNQFYDYYFKYLEPNTKIVKISNNQDIEEIYNKIIKTIWGK
jgi:thymidylate kinase